jgi:hypothetical protein
MIENIPTGGIPNTGGKKIIATLLFLLAAFTVIFLFLWPKLTQPKPKVIPVSSFEECVQYYPVMESYPRQCRSADGVLYTEILTQ